MDMHELHVALKQLAVDLGRSPTRGEFCARVKGAQYSLEKSGMSFTALLQACGLDTYDDRRGKKKAGFSNEVFERDLGQHLEEFQQRPEQPAPAAVELVTIASISDLHFPFVNRKVVNRYLEYVGDVKPDLAVVNGDAWDMYSHTKFPRSHNVFTPREEEAAARKGNEELWQEVGRRSPNTRRVQTLGNHDVRPMKRILEVYPAAEDWVAKHMREIFSFEGVETIFDPRQEVQIGNILIFHGYRSKLGEHRDHTLYNTINGHTHVGGVVFRRIRGQTLWELNSGLAGDPEAKGLTYTPQRITNWTPGFGAVDRVGPRFVPV